MPHINAVPWDEAIRARLPEFPGQSDAEIATALNAETQPGPEQSVLIADAVAYLRGQNAWPAIVKAKDTNDGAWAAVDLANDIRQRTLNFGAPLVQQMLDSLVAASLLTKDQRAALEAMGDTVVPWWQSIGAPAPLNDADIARARED